jgi:peptide/nickel transport system ATP-binding protein
MSTLIEINNLKVHFPIVKQRKFRKEKTVLKAVDGVSIKIAEGEILGLVGESGCGKSTLGKAIIRLINPTEGDVTFHIDDEEVEMNALDSKGLREMWRNMKMIFQDPYSSLNPRMTVSEIIGESLYVNGIAKDKKERTEKVKEIAALCGLNVGQLSRYPHAFSGGQRQRVAIARALVMYPKFIVCDEPVSSLDVSIQAQILNLLKDLQQEFNLTLLLIAHDLSAVSYVSDRVAVMYLGRVVEMADTDKLYYTPKHPYTEALMSAIPSDNPDLTLQPVKLMGEPPNPSNPPSGCAFHTRCSYADGVICSSERPILKEEPEGRGHFVACHYADKLELSGAKKE